MNTINHNLMAANVANTLKSHYGKLATSVERLSSGLRINSAADDAAGLAIRELMRADVAALNQGVRNANDAISMLQVADGALGIIDEKLIRMKELAEQAATGTYNSTQRLIIDSEFQAMASEIERIARATDFNGIKLLDGSLSGTHDGSGLNATGKMKIHFGAANDSAEDYYYVEIGDCTLAGLGLASPKEENGNGAETASQPTWTGNLKDSGIQIPDNLFDFDGVNATEVKLAWDSTMMHYQPKWMSDQFQQGIWYAPMDPIGIWNFPDGNATFMIPKGTKNFVMASYGAGKGGGEGDNDIELFAFIPGVDHPYSEFCFTHLAGTDVTVDAAPLQQADSYVSKNYLQRFTNMRIDPGRHFRYNYMDTTNLNTGPASYDPTGNTLQYSTYNGMTIGYSGDPDRHDSIANDGILQDWDDYEILVINDVTEDVLISVPGFAGASIKMYWDLPASPQTGPDVPSSHQLAVSIKTQDEAQQALERIDDAIVAKDKVRAHLGALQNRLENTVTNLTIQGENLQAAESRISDTDIATEMTIFVRNQVLTQSAVAMLGQANSYPHMLSGLING